MSFEAGGRTDKAGNRFEIRTKDGKSHYIQGFGEFILFFFRNLGNMYYFRVDFYWLRSKQNFIKRKEF